MMKLPDIKDFKPTAAPSAGRKTHEHQDGHVVGLDYEQWAPAIIDLAMRADRVEQERRRMDERGYKKIDGDVTVVGYKQVEVYVIPRALWMQRRTDRAQAMKDKIRTGEMTEFADPARGQTTAPPLRR